MKIVFISDAVLPSPSAESIFVVQMCQSLAELGHDTLLIVPDGKGERRSNLNALTEHYGVSPAFRTETIDFPSQPKAGRIWAWNAACRARESGADIVYSRSIAAAVFATQHDLPVIAEEHQFDGRRHDRWQRLLHPVDDLMRALSGIYHAIFARSAFRSTFRALVRHRGLSNNDTLLRRLSHASRLKRFVVITASLCADMAQAMPALEPALIVAADAARWPEASVSPKPLHGASDRLNVGYCGHLYRGKGIELVEQLARRRHRTNFHIVGGLPEDVACWRKRTADLSNLYFYGHVGPEDVPGYLQAFDICVLPNQASVATFAGGRGKKTKAKADIGRYTSPMKLFEYMAAAKPIVASDLAVIREVLTHEHNGYLADPSDIEAWCRALDRLASTPKLRQRLAAQARHDYVTRYTWPARVERILAGL